MTKTDFLQMSQQWSVSMCMIKIPLPLTPLSFSAFWNKSLHCILCSSWESCDSWAKVSSSVFFLYLNNLLLQEAMLACTYKILSKIQGSPGQRLIKLIPKLWNCCLQILGFVGSCVTYWLQKWSQTYQIHKPSTEKASLVHKYCL